MKKLNVLSVFMVLGLLANISYVYSNEINTDFGIKIKSPIIVSLQDDFTIYPNDIKIRDNDDFEMYAGESVISKYNFENKLNYDLDIVFNLNKNNNNLGELEDILDIFVLDEVDNKTECTINNGDIFEFNDNIVYIQDNFDSKRYFCYYENNQSLKLNLNLKAKSITTKYILFVSKPELENNEDIEYTFNNTIEINSKDLKNFSNNYNLNNNVNPNYDTDDDNSEDSNFVGKLNENFTNIDYNKTVNSLDDFNKTKEIFNDIKKSARGIKSGATGLVTLNISSFSIIFGGLIAVILFSLYITGKSKKGKDFTDLDSI